MLNIALLPGSHACRVTSTLILLASTVATGWLQAGLQLPPLDLLPEYMPALLGNAESQHSLGHLYQAGSEEKHIAKNEKLALRWFRKAADHKCAEAQFDVGLAYEEGTGVEKNQTLANHWYQMSAAQGNAAAECNLGRYYVWKCDDGPSEQKGIKLLADSAEKNNTCALRSLAACYEDGIAVKKDLPRAIELYTKAAENDDAYSQWKLGELYETGTGTKKDLKKAFTYFDAAARNGESRAEIEVATLYQLGGGVERNEEEALAHFRAAADRGDKVAKDFLAAREKGDELSPQYAVFLDRLQKSVKTAWFPIDETRTRASKVKFKVSRAGAVSQLSILKSSGSKVQDERALAAVRAASPLLPLPHGAPDAVYIEFSFDYNVNK